MSNAHKSEAFHEPGPRLAQVGRYTIYESADPDAPPGYVEVFEGEPCGRNRVVQLGLVVRELIAERSSIPDVLKNPMEFAESWYTPHEIVTAISRRRLSERLRNLPTDIDSPEFGGWLCREYRLAMAKGIEIAIRAMQARGSDGSQ